MRVLLWQTIDNHQKGCPTCLQLSELEQVTGSLMRSDCTTHRDIIRNFHSQVAEKASKASDLTDLEKLNYLFPDEYFEQRKEIIKVMIEQGAHPNNITWGYEETPMSQAILFKDDEFQDFLRKHDAK